MESFYVYIYLNPLKPGKFVYEDLIFDFEPFYVGKGFNNRFYDHLKEAIKNPKPVKGEHKLNMIRKILREDKEPIILKLKENLIEKEAFEYEKLYIKVIGRNDLNSGPLTNLTDGGEGFHNTSYLSKEKIKLKSINKCIINNGVKETRIYLKDYELYFNKGWILGRLPFSKDHKEKIGNSNKGKNSGKISFNRGKKMSENRIKKWKETINTNQSFMGKNNPRYINLDENITKKIIELYESKISALKISNILNIGYEKIRNVLKENSIKIRNCQEANILNKGI